MLVTMGWVVVGILFKDIRGCMVLSLSSPSGRALSRMRIGFAQERDEDRTVVQIHGVECTFDFIFRRGKEL